MTAAPEGQKAGGGMWDTWVLWVLGGPLVRMECQDFLEPQDTLGNP